jgi:hypothetical protein
LFLNRSFGYGTVGAQPCTMTVQIARYDLDKQFVLAARYTVVQRSAA